MDKKTVEHVIKGIIGLSCVAVLVVIGLAYQTLDRATSRQPYPANRLVKREKIKQKYGAQPVTFKTEDGLTLSGLLIERPNACRAVLVCHGYGLSKENMRAYIELFPHDTILLFDFRTHGESEGNLISIGHYEQRDIRAAVNFLRARDTTKNIPLVGIGLSMGGATLLGAAGNGVPFDMVIVDSTFADLTTQVSYSFNHYTGMPTTVFKSLAVTMFEYIAGCCPQDVVPAKFITNITCPLLIIHSENDTTAPVENAHRLFAAATSKKTLWLVKGSRHGFIIHDNPEEYKQRVDQFLAKKHTQ